MSKERNEQLEKHTELLATKIIKLCLPLPFNSSNKVLVDQIIRSSASIGANYIEANESVSKKDFIYRIKICRKEARETCYWIRLLPIANPLIKESLKPIHQEAHELFLIFCTILKNVETN